MGDWRDWDAQYVRTRRRGREWGEEHELYRNDVRGLDLGLVEDKLERAIRNIHTDYLQLDGKPRKAVLVVQSLLPTPLLEIALKVLFNHFSQPPSVVVLTTPTLACVGAGLRNALVIEIGWEETVVTAVGEYKDSFQRRSTRAGKMLTQEMSFIVQEDSTSKAADLSFETAEEVTQRFAWCKPRPGFQASSSMKTIPLDVASNEAEELTVSFERLSVPADKVLFATHSTMTDLDDHDLPIQLLVHRVLLALPIDLRALCVSRIIMTDGISALPGLKHRLLYELTSLIEERGWDPVATYGSATPHPGRARYERSAHAVSLQNHNGLPASPMKKTAQDTLPPSQRVRDDVNDTLSRKAERHTLAQTRDNDIVKGIVRGVESRGAWAGASLVASLRIKGVHEVDREEFLKLGLENGGALF